MRFYDKDGQEIDVQDPTFFMDEKEMRQEINYYEELLQDYFFSEEIDNPVV